MRKESKWIAPDGKIHDVTFQEHARYIADVLGLHFEEDHILRYYDSAFKEGYIRVAILDAFILVQLESKASYEQRKIVADYLNEFNSILVIFGKQEGEIVTKTQLNKALSGLNPFC